MNKYYEQETKWTCGPACARMMLYDLGIEADESHLCDILNTMEGTGTRSDMWCNLSEAFDVEVQTGSVDSLEELEDLRKAGWQLTLMVFDGMPHYIRYRGLTEHKVLYWNPYFFKDSGMKKKPFLERWYMDTDNYFEVGVVNCERLVLDKFYIGIRKR
jgi:ABC-type bacteriocin/lantibiotic exporter with double-glycine peptidase domain